MNVIKIGFEDDLWQTALNASQRDAVYVFPTRAAAGAALNSFQHSWQKGQQAFMSMEDFEAAVILPDAPVLSDEKRLLCLYLVLSAADRETLHINGYNDIVEWGKRFFDFFGELAEELIDVDSLPQKLQEGMFNWLLWQEQYLDTILQIRRNYLNYISALGFTDRIFYLDLAHAMIPWQNRDVVFINQYYYNALHKEVISLLEQAGNRVTLIFQGLEVNFHGVDWKVEDFDLAKAWADLEHKPLLRVVECENEDQMALAYLGDLQQGKFVNGGGVIIDSSFHQKPYRRFFDPRVFHHPHGYAIADTGLNQVLASLVEGIKAWQDSTGFLPVNLLARWFASWDFVHYFAASVDEQVMTALLNELQVPLQQDYLYLDEDYFNKLPDGWLKRTGMAYLEHIKAFARVSSIADICDLLDNPRGLDLARLLDAEELAHTSLLSDFWRQVANFRSIESLGLVKQWQEVFGTQDCALPLLELFLQYLKSIRVSYTPLAETRPDWEISNLLDARNRVIGQLVYFQLIEGLLPSSPSPVWLFSEAQRKRLKLKNYDDVRAWERYYFFRLLLCSQQAVCYTHRNMERDVNPSSFIGELRFVLGENGMELPTETIASPMEQVYASRMNCPDINQLQGLRTSGACSLQSPPDEDFFVLPVDPVHDFGEHHALAASVSGLLQLLRNPFLWYLESKCRLNPIPYEAPETISNKLFGNIMHAYFARILGDHQGQHQGTDELDNFFGDRDYLQQNLTSLILEGAFRYQIPRNYNGEFLNEIISQRLAESIADFYLSWLRGRLDKKSYTLIPECATLTDHERLYRELGSVNYLEHQYRLLTRGKADLRIETDDQAMIIDFKTGSKDTNQLIIYEWLYYLLGDTWHEEKITSIFWYIMESEPSMDKITPQRRDKLKTLLLDTLKQCLEQGYVQGSKAADRARLRTITRADLYRPNREVQDA